MHNNGQNYPTIVCVNSKVLHLSRQLVVKPLQIVYMHLHVHQAHIHKCLLEKELDVRMSDWKREETLFCFVLLSFYIFYCILFITFSTQNQTQIIYSYNFII